MPFINYIMPRHGTLAYPPTPELLLAHGLIGQLLFGTKGGIKGQRPCRGDPDCIGRHKS